MKIEYVHQCACALELINTNIVEWHFVQNCRGKRLSRRITTHSSVNEDLCMLNISLCITEDY